MGLFSYLVVTVIGGAAVTLFPPLIGPVASMVGMGSVGVGAGTVAAGAQAYVGNVAAGSVFSALQSVAMASPTP
uniref:Uncharacterized protein n=1 Tax=Riptortus pedestris TaxID=329032 RepID=R4WCM5_RIPPE|nr:unknown secreted protein [Riptortus pedestris]